MNQTPLMAASASGNVALVEALLERGASQTTTDHFGYNALHWAIKEAFANETFAKGPFAALYDRLAPASVDVNTGARLVRIDRHLSEYFLLQTFWVLFKSRFTYRQHNRHAALDTQDILEAWEHLPASVVPKERQKRSYLSGVLARNEVSRDYAYNRALFKRRALGSYQLNPALSVRRQREGEEMWVSIFEALNLPFIAEFTPEFPWGGGRSALEIYLAEAGLPAVAIPIAS